MITIVILKGISEKGAEYFYRFGAAGWSQRGSSGSSQPGQKDIGSHAIRGRVGEGGLPRRWPQR